MLDLLLELICDACGFSQGTICHACFCYVERRTFYSFGCLSAYCDVTCTLYYLYVIQVYAIVYKRNTAIVVKGYTEELCCMIILLQLLLKDTQKSYVA